MFERNAEIINPSGIHARPATKFVAEAKKYQSGITITNMTTGRSADAKSIIKVLALGLTKGTVVSLKAEGEDEQAAVLALGALIAAGVGESI